MNRPHTVKDEIQLGFRRVTGSMLQFRLDPPMTPPRDIDRMDRERLRQQSSAGDMLGQQALGGVMFGVMSALVAHMPDPVRIIFDGDLRIAPALLPDAALGIGCGVRF